jgi:iron complex outermembrane receptor protein
MKRKHHLILLFGLGLTVPTVHAETSGQDALDLSLEELMSVVVTSASKKSQTLAETAAAVHVISAEEIRRSGASNIPEALRLAPGVQVSAIGNNKWAVSIRGFADRFSNKLLVLVDGRSVYTPLFSGVFWESLDVPLEMITRIEVIRGPGASIWGANAVNGVINILTRSPFDTLGSQVAVAAGSELRGYGYARHGWSPDPDTAISLHAKAHDVDASRQTGGGEGVDDWQSQTAGFKLERLLARGTLHVQGGISRTRAGDELTLISISPTTALPVNPVVQSTEETSNSHLLARWEGVNGEDSQDSLQFSLEHSDYRQVILTEHRVTVDLEYQQRRPLSESQDLIWGLGYRYSTDRIGSSPLIHVSEPERDIALYSAYAQDEITLMPERWRLSLGARLERNDYTGIVFQPNLRLLWTPDVENSVWLSLSRAVRTPSRIERGGTVYIDVAQPGVPPPNIAQLVSHALADEHVNALDLGWRHRFNTHASLDLAAFHYQYEKLRGVAATAPQFVPPGYLLIQTPVNNANSAEVSGLEASLDWRPAQDWRLQASYGWLSYKVSSAPFPNQLPSDYVDVSPTHQFSLRSSLDLSPDLRWDTWVRHVSRIKRYDTPAYTTLDMRLAWQARKALEIALVGQNLLDSAHPEFGSTFIQSTPSEVERGIYLKADWKF